MIRPVMFFLAGVLSLQQLAVLPNGYGVAQLLLLLAFFVWRGCGRLIFFTSGVLWALCVAMLVIDDRLDEQWQGREVVVRGYIAGLPVAEGKRTKFDFIVAEPHYLPRKIRLNWYFPEREIRAGQGWRLTVKLKKPRSTYNPGAFDYERWLFSHRIGAVGYVRKQPAPVLLEQKSPGAGISVWRQDIAERLRQLLADGRHLGLIKALTIGDRSAIKQAEWAVFRKTGTVHLIAISGLHIGLVASLVYVLALRLWAYSGVLALSPQKVAVAAALTVAFCYAALAGFSLPTRRALLMLTVAMLAIYWQRHVKPLHAFALALFTVVLLDPLAVLSASFWLSFGAVLLILYTLSARLGRVGYWRALLKIHWVSAIGLAPLIMYYFQQVSLVAPLANLLAVPAVSLAIVPLALVAVAMLFIQPFLAEALLHLVEWMLHALWLFLSACAELPYAALTTTQPPLYALLLAFLGVLLLLAPRGIPGRYLGALLCLPIIFVEVDRPAEGESRITLLNVGQGLAAVVETHHHVLVFDSGAKYSERFDMGNAVVLPYLRYRGVSEVDTLLISHGDNDHIGGAESILAQMPVAEIISSVALFNARRHGRSCQRGQGWEWDGVRFTMLAPPQQGYFQDDNDNSCVLKVSTANHSFLLTGDIEWPAEQWLVGQYGRILNSDVLISPHHGSRTSSSLKFLQLVDPEVALIPAGYRNRFGFPHRQVLQRYHQQQIIWLNSFEEGAIIIDTNSETVSIVSSREKFRRYWMK
ncbi:DNA internalization-related competence protein ComEC/Rec2 [Methylomarinum sp. Ch1-1]|uniref:DNA internalization-related competence protein ComEC/Rec2 n=1 Tax=Methylomarinum roseum TaxID=3067653 RepID=A0AAU7NZY3_9GAMM